MSHWRVVKEFSPTASASSGQQGIFIDDLHLYRRQIKLRRQRERDRAIVTACTWIVSAAITVGIWWILIENVARAIDQ